MANNKLLLLVYFTTATSILKLAHVLEVTCTLKCADICSAFQITGILERGLFFHIM